MGVDGTKRLSLSYKVDVPSRQSLSIPKYCFRIICYSTASTESAAYFIGGEDVGGKYFSTIAEFKDDEWRNIGDLVKARSSPSTIIIGDEAVIVGGFAYGAKYVWT